MTSMDQLQLWGEDLGIGELCRGISEIFPEDKIPIEEILKDLMEGDMKNALYRLFAGQSQKLLQEIMSLKELFVWILILGILATLLSRFVELFNKNQVADLSFYLVYLCAVSVLFESFTKVLLIARETMERIQMFIKLLIPTYLISVGIATGTVTATASYEMMTVLLYLVQRVLIDIVLPMVSAYMLLSVMNEIWIEEKLSLLMDFLNRCISWILKISVGIVSGISFFQAALNPVIDSAKTSVIKKTIGALPGVGDGVEGAMEVFLGSAVVIKNSAGILILLLLIYLCFVPLLKIFLLSFVLKGTAALVGVVCDRRLSSCTNHTGEAGMLLFKTVSACLFLFFVSLAFVSLSVKRF